MDLRFVVNREELSNLQMEVKQMQHVQNTHADRLLRLERRQNDDAALKSVWQSPFPGVLASTPQQGPVLMPNDMFGDMDEQGAHLLGSLHLGTTDDEPIRRGAASRANSVRFDESALAASSWGGQSRHSGDFGPLRSGGGPFMERSFSHKSDGRHSSAGHSVHSVHSTHSLHSLHSGRGSSLGIETNFGIAGNRDDESPLDIPEPPPGLFILGSVPSIIRCWLTTQFSHDTLLYADVCTGSQKSTVEYSLLEELNLVDDVEAEVDGVRRIRLPVYLAEAIVTQPSARPRSPEHSMPSILVSFEVLGWNQVKQMKGANEKGIQVFIGSDALRAHSADVLLSRNQVLLYGNEREKLCVPFVRPEDENTFKNICTTNLSTAQALNSKPVRDAQAQSSPIPRPTPGPGDMVQDHDDTGYQSAGDHDSRTSSSSPALAQAHSQAHVAVNSQSDNEVERERPDKDVSSSERDGKEPAVSTPAPSSVGDGNSRRESAPGIWGSWRHTGGTNYGDSAQRENISGYQPAPRGSSSRNMKVLKVVKSSSSTSSIRTNTSATAPALHEGSGPARNGSEVGRWKPQAGSSENGTANAIRWESKRTVSGSSSSTGAHDAKPAQSGPLREGPRNAQGLPRTANPIGGASAFSWMTPQAKT